LYRKLFRILPIEQRFVNSNYTLAFINTDKTNNNIRYMGAMNQFLASNQSKTIDYLQEVGVMIHAAQSLPQRQSVADHERRAAFDTVHRLAAPLLPQIEARAKLLFPPSSAGDEARLQCSTFAGALQALGAPPPLYVSCLFVCLFVVVVACVLFVTCCCCL
jgi:hypothetical protein